MTQPMNHNTVPTSPNSPKTGFIEGVKSLFRGEIDIKLKKALVVAPLALFGTVFIADKLNDHTDMKVLPVDLAGTDGWNLRAPYGDATWNIFDGPSIEEAVTDVSEDLTETYSRIGTFCVEQSEELTNQISLDASGNLVNATTTDAAKLAIFNDCVAQSTAELTTEFTGIPVPQFKN